MLDIGWSELLVIGVVALIVVGPKDLPGMFRTLGQFTGKMRRMARDFQRAMDDAAKDTGINETAKTLKNATSSKSLGLDTLKSAADRFEKWEPPKPIRPADAETAKQREARAAETKRILDEAAQKRAPAVAPSTGAPRAPEPAPTPRDEPRAVPARERPGTPTARGARPKIMPKKKPGRGRG